MSNRAIDPIAKADRGPFNYVVASFNTRESAEGMADVINCAGLYEAVALHRKGKFDVLLPGQCTVGTEAYMEGFCAAFFSLKGVGYGR